jgi:hypothetical protein
MIFANETRSGYDNVSIGVRDAYWAVHAKGVTSWESS